MFSFHQAHILAAQAFPRSPLVTSGSMVKLPRGFIVAILAALGAIACRDDEPVGPRNTTPTPSFVISPGTGKECVFDQVRSFDGEGFARGADPATSCNTFGRIDPWTPIYFNPDVSIAWISDDPDDLMPRQPGPVTFTFHRPILNPVVVTSGEMACLGDPGQVIAHTISEQTVTVSLQVAGPEDCGLDNKTSQYISPAIITSEPIRMIEIMPPSVMEWHFEYTITVCDPDGSNCRDVRVTGDPRAHVGYSVYFRETPDVVPELHLDCSPSTVERGEPVSCRARTEPEGGAMQITGWQFAPADPSFGPVDRPEFDVAKQDWSGPMVIGGVVRVTAVVAGVSQTTSAEISVDPRNWVHKPIVPQVTVNRPGSLKDRPKKDEDLGSAGFDVVMAAPLVAIEDGPNMGFWYFTDIPATVNVTIEINTAALAVGSEFWKVQDLPRIGGVVIIGTRSCTRDDVVPLVPLVEAHEDLHKSTFLQKFVELAGPFFEPRIGRTGDNLPGFQDDLNGFRRQALKYSNSITHGSANPFRPPCIIRYGPYPSK